MPSRSRTQDKIIAISQESDLGQVFSEKERNNGAFYYAVFIMVCILYTVVELQHILGLYESTPQPDSVTVKVDYFSYGATITLRYLR